MSKHHFSKMNCRNTMPTSVVTLKCLTVFCTSTRSCTVVLGGGREGGTQGEAGRWLGPREVPSGFLDGPSNMTVGSSGMRRSSCTLEHNRGQTCPQAHKRSQDMAHLSTSACPFQTHARLTHSLAEELGMPLAICISRTVTCRAHQAYFFLQCGRGFLEYD